MNTNEMNLNEIMAEVKADEFCECATKENKVVKMNMAKNPKKNKNVIDKNTAVSLAKIIALMGATGICGYLKLMSPILYIPIELVSLCVGCFKVGEYKGKTEAENR